MGLFENFPYSNFHNLNLDWIMDKVKEFEGKMDGLEATITEIVQKELDNKNLNELILNALTTYGLVINVQAPPSGLTPSKGDGSTDDTLSIQGCIDYAFNHNGMTVFFPSGSYLTGSLTLKNKVALVGLSEYNTKLVLKGGALAPLITGSNINTCITGLTLDSNGEYQVNDINVLNLIAEKAVISNCVLTKGDIVADITVNNELKIENVTFLGASKKNLVLTGNGRILCNNIILDTLSEIDGVCFAEINSNKTVITNCFTVGVASKSFIVNGNNNQIVFSETYENGYTDNGSNNSISINSRTETKKFTSNVTHETGGIYTEKVSGNKVSNITGLDTKTVTGKETVNNNSGFERVITGNGDVSASGSFTETFIGNKKTTASSIENESTELILKPTQPLTYKSPVTFDPSFGTIPFKDYDGVVYNVMVNKQTMERRTYHVRDFGAVGDGVTDDTEAIQACVNYNSTDLLKTVIIDTGRYHTTAPIVLPPNIYITCDQYGSACFLDSFAEGTFKLSNNCWIENLLLLGSANGGFAFYGTEIQSVTIKNVQNSGATSGATNPTSGFLKLTGDWSIIMIDNCLMDSGGATGFTCELLGQDNWTGGNIFGDRDIFFRNCFIDNFQPIDNQGGVFYIDSIKDVRFQNCIIRSSSNTFVEASTHTGQSTTVYATNCIIERSTTSGYVITLPDNTFFENMNNVLGPTSYVLNNGVFTNYDTSKCVRLPIISDNYFSKDTGVAVTKNGNGTYSFSYFSSAIDTNQGIWKNVNTQKNFARVGFNYYGKTIASTRYGIALRNSTSGDQLMFCIVPDSDSMNVSKWSGFGSTYVSDSIAPIKIDISNLEIGIKKNGSNYEFWYSKDGVYWTMFGSVTPDTTYDKIGLFANCGEVVESVEVNNHVQMQINYYTEN